MENHSSAWMIFISQRHRSTDLSPKFKYTSFGQGSESTPKIAWFPELGYVTTSFASQIWSCRSFFLKTAKVWAESCDFDADFFTLWIWRGKNPLSTIPPKFIQSDRFRMNSLLHGGQYCFIYDLFFAKTGWYGVSQKKVTVKKRTAFWKTGPVGPFLQHSGGFCSTVDP